MFAKSCCLLTCCSLVFSFFAAPIFGATHTATLPEGTRVYVVLEERLSGKRGEAEVGQMAQCRVWRDVVVGGEVLIKAGAPVIVKIASIKHANIAGIKGKMSLAAYETKAVDGQTVQLTGGYMKEGKSRMALSISLGAVLFLPLVFITGKAAELPQGMVFDVFTGPDTAVKNETQPAPIPVVNLGEALNNFSAEVLYEKLQQEQKPEFFTFKVQGDGEIPTNLLINSVNGKQIERLSLEIVSSETKNGFFTVQARIPIKVLAKHFQRGINRFDVAKVSGKDAATAEVVLNIQF